MPIRYPTPRPTFVLLLLLALTGGCATTYVKPTAMTNPPPAEPFSHFDEFEVRPIELMPPYAGQEANEAAVMKIQENLDQRLDSILGAWNDDASDGASPRVLLIEPRVESIKFISGGARFWAGAMAGSSAVLMKVKFSEKATGTVIAEPEFWQRAAAMGGAWTFGATDNQMLVREAELVASYMRDNYANAVGGSTGATAESLE